MTSLNLKPVSSSGSQHKPKPHPTSSALKPWDFSYASSIDGSDKNLLIMFHGLGDSKTPFFGLGKQLNLPSTAVLSLSAPDPIPLMDHPSFSWCPTLTNTYDPIPPSAQNPTKNLPLLRKMIEALISPDGCGWDLKDIHLFGWGQGGTMVLELALEIGKNGITAVKEAQTQTPKQNRFGSAVSICASLLTHPTTTDPNLNNTPICYFTRLSPKSSIHTKHLTPIKRAFREVTVIQGVASGGGGGGGGDEGMPRGREEWFGIMKFWGQVLARKDQGWKGQGEVYEVVR
ncbi:hypothetical protein IAT40_002252 [Kwoniella sp. CBS 6097]